MLKLDAIARFEANAKRVGEITKVAARFGLTEWIGVVPLSWVRDQLKTEEGEEIKSLTTGERARKAFSELGTTFIKLGQVLSTRSDLVGTEVAKELSKLQTDAPADPAEAIRKLIASELGMPAEQLVDEFVDTPLGSGSIAQVHQARLKSGELVAIKVQHPGIRDKIMPDLEILEALAELVEKHSETLRAYQPVSTIAQFRRILLQELDFTHERTHIEHFINNFEDDETVQFPGVHKHLCSRRVLTMDYLQGVSGSDPVILEENISDRTEFARKGADVFLNMIFRDGLYHADPHPGNLMLLPNGVVGILDCGMVGRIDEALREEVEMLLMAVTTNDVERLTDAVLRLGDVPPDCPRDRLRSDLDDFLATLIVNSIQDIDLGEALSTIVDLIHRYKIVLRPRLALLLKTVVVLEGTSQRLSPEVSLAELIKPHHARAMRRRLSPRSVWMRLSNSVRDWERLLSGMPRELEGLLGRVRAGSYTVKLSHRHLDPVVNRLATGVIIAALIVGGSALWSSQSPPLIQEVPVIGAICFALAMFLGWRLFRAIKQSEKADRED